MNRGPLRFSWPPRGGIIPAGATDADLLARFTESRDEAAFELLVRRHSGMVFAACRRVLNDPNDADDAFQAVFLILARKAGSIARAEVMAGWLHKVAVRAALHLRAARARRRNREEPGVDKLPAPDHPGDAQELARVLDEEIGRLPPRNRTAFILCCLEGKSGEEAARLLGCPPGTVSSRLTRARERLRERLTRRGFAPAIIAAAIAGDTAPAVPVVVLDSTLSAALSFAAGLAFPGGPLPRSATLAHGVLRTMTLTKLRFAAMFLVSALLAAGAVLAASKDAPVVDNDKAAVKVALRPNVGGQGTTIHSLCYAVPSQQVDLYPMAAGTVSAVNVDIGDRVKKGQVLAELSSPMLTVDERLAAVAVDQAKGAQREAEARIFGVKAELRSAESALQQREAEAKAARANMEFRKKNYERMKNLAAANAIDAKLLEEAESQVLAATETANAKTISIEGARADINVMKAKLMQAEAPVVTAKLSVDTAKLNLEKALIGLAGIKVVAPFDGVVTMRNCSIGDYVRHDRSGDRGRLFTIVGASAIRIVVEVPERDILRIQPGIAATIAMDALPGKTFAAKVARYGYVADPKNRTMRVEIDLPNVDGKVRPGMTGSAVLTPVK